MLPGMTWSQYNTRIRSGRVIPDCDGVVVRIHNVETRSIKRDAGAPRIQAQGNIGAYGDPALQPQICSDRQTWGCSRRLVRASIDPWVNAVAGIVTVIGSRGRAEAGRHLWPEDAARSALPSSLPS